MTSLSRLASSELTSGSFKINRSLSRKAQPPRTLARGAIYHQDVDSPSNPNRWYRGTVRHDRRRWPHKSLRQGSHVSLAQPPSAQPPTSPRQESTHGVPVAGIQQ